MDLRRHRRFLYIVILIISFSANAAISILWPRTGGDWDSYGTVAENIYMGHGVSLSVSPPYTPAFGGNAFPGYPAFIALVWSVFGKSYPAVRVAQSLLFAISVAVFSFVISRVFHNEKIGIASGIITALSPLTMAWSRSLQVEALSIASVMLFFALLFQAFSEKRIRVIATSLSILFAVYLRTDGLLLFIPLAILLFVRDAGRKRNFMNFVSVGVIVSLGIGAWFVRNRLVGMEKITPPAMLVLNEKGEVYPPPYGYVLWGWTWMSKEYERGGWGFPVTRAGYDTIYIPTAAFDNEQEAARVGELLERLKEYKGRPFPAHIDDRFREIALEKIRRNPLKVFVILPAKRMVGLWFHPGSSEGWPLEMVELTYEERTELERNLLSGALYLLNRHPVKILGKGVIFSSALLVCLAGFVGLWLLLRSDRRAMGMAILAYFLLRSMFYAWTNNVESRYLAQHLPILQFLTGYAAVSLTMKWKSSRKPVT